MYIFYREAVNQDRVGGVRQALEGPEHGQTGGPVDVQGVDLLRRGQAHPDRRGLPEEACGQLGPLGRSDTFGVVDGGDPSRGAADEPLGGEDDGGGHEGPEEGSAADLIDPGDPPGALAGELFLESEGGHGPPALA